MISNSILACSKVITTHSFESKLPSNPVNIFNHHRGIVNTAVFNHTNKVIASAGQDGKIILVSSEKPQNILAQFMFDPMKAGSLHTLNQNNIGINCAIFSPHSKFIAAGATDNTIKIWQMKNHKEVYLTLRNHTAPVTSLAWNKAQQLLFSSSAHGQILINNIKTGSIVQQLAMPHQEGINCLRYSQGISQQKNFNRLAACTDAGSIMIWDVEANKKLAPICSFQNSMKVSITSLSFSSYNPVLMVTASIDQNLTFYDITEKKPVKNIVAQQPLTSVNFHYDGHTLLAGGMHGGLFIYDLRKPQKPKQKLSGHSTAIKYIDFHKQRQAIRDTGASKERSKGLTSHGSVNKFSKKQIEQPPLPKAPQIKLSQTSSNGFESKEKQFSISNPTAYIPLPKRQENSNVKQNRLSISQKPGSVQQPNQYSQSQMNVQSLNISSSPPKIQPNNEQMQNRIMRAMQQKFQLFHLQMIRQFQIQREQFKFLLEKNCQDLQSKDQRIRQLQEQNAKLKKTRY